MSLDAFKFAPVVVKRPITLGQRLRRQTWKKRQRAKDKGAPAVTLTHREWVRLCRAFDYCCVYCGIMKGSPRDLTQDHKVPLSRGGSHTFDNVVPACLSCNSAKKDMTAGEFFEWWLERSIRG